jgi:manganese transport protein
MFTSSRAKMGEHVNPLWAKVAGFTVCALISGLNVYLLWETIGAVWVIAIAGAMGAFAAWVRWGRQAEAPAA